MPLSIILPRRSARPNGIVARVSQAALARASDAALPGHGCCFTFHRAARAADWAALPNRGFHLDLHYLEHLIRHLQRTGWDIVTMSEAVRRTASREGGRFVNFSVDDCYLDTAELVVPLFRRLGAPVTLYVTTGLPDGTLRLRDAGLETILLAEDHVTLADRRFDLQTAAAKRAAFTTISAQLQEAADDTVYERFCRQHGYDPHMLDAQHRLSWDTLSTWRDDRLVEIGGHTVSHSRIAALPQDQAFAELAGCRARLEAVLDREVQHFAFPYGRRGDCGPRDFALVRKAGFTSAATTRKGLLAPGADPFRLPRNTLHGEHRALPIAYMHLSGASGVAARVLRRD